MRSALLAAVLWTLPLSMAHADFSPREIYKDTSPGVVLVLGADKGGAGSGGTGSIISPEGKVITNAHVVVNAKTGKPYTNLYVFLKPAKISGDNKRDLVNRYKAKVLSYSPAEQLDLALLQIENAPSNLKVIAFANPD
ncbi:MAG: trypsin-like peptidase domain-containing protein, partial [Myxococcota bacterium]